MKKILLIDDNQDMHLMVSYMLKKAGYQMISAYSGDEGLAKVCAERPDLVILDFMMPGKDGKQVFEEFASKEKYREFRTIPFVMLTARQTTDTDREHLLKLGMAAFLTKPFGQKELIDIIESILTTHRLRMEEQNLLAIVSDTRNFLAKLVESIPSALFIVKEDGIISFYNGGHRNVLGYAPDEVVGHRFEHFLSQNEVNQVRAKQLLAGHETKVNVELELVSKNRAECPFSFSAASFKGIKGNYEGRILVGSDISELKRLQQLAIEREKLAMLTETAVAVNHEINNPLSPILGNVQLLLDDPQLDERTKARLIAIQRNAIRIQEITKKLRKIKKPVSKKYIGDTQMLDIHESG